MRIDDGENRNGQQSSRGGSQNGQRRSPRENPARKTNPEVAGKNRERAMYERGRVRRESYAKRSDEGSRYRASAENAAGEGAVRRPRPRLSEGMPSERVLSESEPRKSRERKAPVPEKRQPFSGKIPPAAGRDKRPAADDGLFDDLSIDEDILGNKGMEDKIFNQAMNSSGAERKKPRELNTAKTIINRDEYSSEKQAKKKSRVKKIIIFSILEIITLTLILGYGYFLRTWNKMSDKSFDKAAVENNNIDITKKEAMKGYWTFAVFGLDSRNTGVGKGNNSDVIMLVSINRDSGDIKVCSVFRDTYLNISDGNRYAKINEAYAAGGPEQAVKALNKNLDLNIENYVTFDWKAVADAINILGGVDNIDISKAELYYINAYITETVKYTGIGSTQLKSTGVQHLDGVQAVAYMRLRYMDNDFARTERQREVLQACFEKAKEADFGVLNNIIVVLADQIATNISPSEMVSLAQGITKYSIAGTGGFPWARGDANIPKKGACVIPTTLESNVKMLHEFLYGDADYEVSKAVLGYSEKIKQDSNLYKEGKPIESVGTDGGYIPKPKSKTAADADEKKEKTKDKDSEDTFETDKDGNIVYPTDSNGNPVYPTNEDGDVVLPTDEDGKAILPSSSAADKETRPTSLADDDAVETGNDYGSDIVGPDGDIMPSRPGTGETSGSPGTMTSPGTTAREPGNSETNETSGGPGASTDESAVNPTRESRPTQVVNPTMDTAGSSHSGGSKAPGTAPVSPISPGLTGGPGSQNTSPNAA